MKSVEDVRSIPGVPQRLDAAVVALRQAEAKAESARADRAMAVIVARLDHGVKPVSIYRDTLDISHSLYWRILNRAPGKDLRPVMRDPMRRAKAAHRKVAEWDEAVSALLQIRDEAAVSLMNGQHPDGSPLLDGDGEPLRYSNAKVARITGLSTARVAQMRNGE